MTHYKDVLILELQRCVAQHGTVIAAICGPADVGKSTLCLDLVERLNKLGVSADVFTLDGYLIPRSERLERNLSGYEPTAYDLQKVASDLQRTLSGNAITRKTYCHQTGQPQRTIHAIKPVQILLLDGLHSMHGRIKYQQYVAPYQAGADLVMELNMKWQFKLQKK